MIDDPPVRDARATRYTAFAVTELRRRSVILEEGEEAIAFSCPHCAHGRGVLEFLRARWRCLDCPADGVSESLAITLGVDPEIRLFEPSRLAMLAQQGATGSDPERVVARITSHLLRRRVDPVVALELVAAWADRRCDLKCLETERVVESIARRELARRRE
jgi:hypothetical protein